MKKSIIILGIILSIIIVLVVIKSVSKPNESDSDYLTNYLKENNYTKNEEEYTKVVTDDDEINDVTDISDYDSQIASKKSVEMTTLNLDPKTFTFKKENRTYSEDVEKIYNGVIELKEDNIIKFEYMINIYTTQIMVEGSYDLNNEYSDDNYKCSLYYQSGLDEDQDESEKIYCLLAKNETLDFIADINKLKDDQRIYKMIKE